MGTIRLSDDFVSPAINKANPKITLNQKSHQQITAEIERYWDKETYNSDFELIPVNLKNKVHLYINSTDAGYAHGQLSWTPNTFVNGGEINSDLTVNVTDATVIPVSIPTGYDDYYLHNSVSNFYEDTNYDNYKSANQLSGNVILFDLDGYLSQTTSMYGAIEYANNITALDVSNLNTSNITNMRCTFHQCRNLTSLDLSNWNTSNVTNMLGTFADCNNLVTLNIANLDTSKVETCENLFQQDRSLISLNVSLWNMSKNEVFYYMFSFCSALTSLDLSNWNTSSGIFFNNMFYGCSNLRVLDISNFDTTQEIREMPSMFSGCNNLQYLIIGSPTFKFQLKESQTLPSNCKILVPSALISTYQNATNWSAHASKFDAIENYTITRSNGQVTVTPKNA